MTQFWLPNDVNYVVHDVPNVPDDRLNIPDDVFYVVFDLPNIPDDVFYVVHDVPNVPDDPLDIPDDAKNVVDDPFNVLIGDGHRYNVAGDIPTPTMLQAWMTFRLSRSASASTSSDSVPGLSQSSSQPFAAMSGNTFSNTGGGR